MRNFAFIMNQTEDGESAGNRIKKICHCINFFRKDIDLEMADICGSVLYVIRMKRVARYAPKCIISNGSLHRLEKVIKENDIAYYLLPTSIGGIVKLENAFEISFRGRLLFKSLVARVILKLFNESKNISVCVVGGDDFNELIAILNMILKVGKNITVVTKDKEVISEFVEKIYEKTGIPVWVTCGFENAINDSDVIVNLSNLSNMKYNFNLEKNKHIINIGGGEGSYEKVIDKLKIKIPECIKNNLDKKVWDNFDEIEIAEALLFWGVMARYSSILSLSESDLLFNVSEEFIRQRYDFSIFSQS